MGLLSGSLMLTGLLFGAAPGLAQDAASENDPPEEGGRGEKEVKEARPRQEGFRKLAEKAPGKISEPLKAEKISIRR